MLILIKVLFIWRSRTISRLFTLTPTAQSSRLTLYHQSHFSDNSVSFWILFCVSLTCLASVTWLHWSAHNINSFRIDQNQIDCWLSERKWKLCLEMGTKRTLLRLLWRKSNVSINSSSSISFRPSSSLSISSVTDQFTFSCSGLPRVKEVHHPNRVKDNVLHPAFDIVIPEVIQLGFSDWILLTKNLTFAFSKTFQITYCEFLWSNIAMHEHLPGVWPFPHHHHRSHNPSHHPAIHLNGYEVGP